VQKNPVFPTNHSAGTSKQNLTATGTTSASITWAVKLCLLENAYSCPVFRPSFRCAIRVH